VKAAENAAHRARLDAARAVLDRLGADGAVDGVTRDSRRASLLDVARELQQLRTEARGALRREADALRAKLLARLDAIDPPRPGTFLAHRGRTAIVVRTVAIVLELMAAIKRSRAPWAPDGADELALRPLFFFLGEWLDALCNVDDYLAAGLGGNVRAVSEYHLVWFHPASADRLEAVRRVADEKRVRAAHDTGETPEQGHARRARQHLNAAHLALAEHAAPFGCDGVFARSTAPLMDVDQHLALAAKGIGSAGAGPDVEELRGELARLDSVLVTARAASTKPSADDRRAA
jgi:hypothetical protein